MKTTTLFTLLFGVLVTLTTGFTQMTPGKGSPERKAICDAARITLSQQFKQDTKNVLFKIQTIQIAGNYAVMSAHPVLANDKQPPNLPDLNYTFFLYEKEGNWKTLKLYAHGDPLSRPELISELPKDFPTVLFNALPMLP